MGDPSHAALSRLVDRTAISELLYDYAYCVDSNRVDQLLGLFVEDCAVAYGTTFGAHGRSELRGLMSGIPDYFAATSHHISNITVSFNGPDHADLRAVVYAWHRYVEPKPDAVWLGYYQDRVLRTDDGWRISSLEMQTTGSSNHHLPVKFQIPFERLPSAQGASLWSAPRGTRGAGQ
jgi:3-phenylpropionate/cinnamic acid dioxygenase small subunit